MEDFKSICDGEREVLFEMKEVCKKGTNILTFYIFESGAESGAKCIAESGAK